MNTIRRFATGDIKSLRIDAIVATASLLCLGVGVLGGALSGDFRTEAKGDRVMTFSADGSVLRAPAH